MLTPTFNIKGKESYLNNILASDMPCTSLFIAFVFLPQYNNLEVFHLSELAETIAPEGKLSFVQLFSHCELL